MVDIATVGDHDSISRATLVYLTLVSGLGRAVAFSESMAGRTDDPGAPLIDPNPVTRELDAYDFGRMLMDTAKVDHRTFRWPAQGIDTILTAAERLPIAGMARREHRLRWIDAELRAAGSSLAEARALTRDTDR